VSERVPVVHRAIRDIFMSAQFGAKFAANGLAAARHCISSFIILAAAIVAAGSTPAFARMAGDPADPAARSAGVGYRSTVAPYTARRPSAPAPWRARNDSVAPQPKTGREPK
jgi:hypothetical protein